LRPFAFLVEWDGNAFFLWTTPADGAAPGKRLAAKRGLII